MKTILKVFRKNGKQMKTISKFFGKKNGKQLRTILKVFRKKNGKQMKTILKVFRKKRKTNENNFKSFS